MILRYCIAVVLIYTVDYRYNESQGSKEIISFLRGVLKTRVAMSSSLLSGFRNLNPLKDFKEFNNLPMDLDKFDVSKS